MVFLDNILRMDVRFLEVIVIVLCWGVLFMIYVVSIWLIIDEEVGLRL